MSEKDDALGLASVARIAPQRLSASAVEKELRRLHKENERLRRNAESYQKHKDRNYRLQQLLKECRKVMQANGVFRDTKVHKDLKTRIRVELENKT